MKPTPSRRGRPALPVVLWGSYLGLLGSGLWVWIGWGLGPALLLGAGAAMALVAAAVWLRPASEPSARAVPAYSLPALPLAAGTAALLVGAEVGLWLMLIGAGLMVLGAGALAREVLSQRRAQALARDIAARAHGPLVWLLVLGAGAMAVSALATPRSAARGNGQTVARGEAPFQDGCSGCHGLAARGVPGRGPSLRGVGALAADFYLRTGRMPLAAPDEQPVRKPPAYGARDRRALVAYVASFGGPGVPAVDAQAGSVAEGQRLFTDRCAGCHQVQARGGIVTGAIAPSLQDASSRDVAEAVRIGPYLMPRFDRRQLDQSQVDSIARYLRSTRHPDDAGGWGIGHLGPIPEGMVAWLLAAACLLVVARLIGERTGS